MAAVRETLFDKRKRRARFSLKRNSGGRIRLSVFHSGKHIYAQLIDDVKGVTLAQASTVDKEVKAGLKNGSNKDAAAKVGELIAKRGKAAKVNEVVFDRGGYLYHGRVKALGDAARAGGHSF